MVIDKIISIYEDFPKRDVTKIKAFNISVLFSTDIYLAFRRKKNYTLSRSTTLTLDIAAT